MNKRKTKTTIIDIADKLGIAHSTVSRALADSPLISEKTKQQVRRAAEQMNYARSKSGRKPKKRQTNIIELVYFTLAEHIQNDPLLLLILDSLNTELERYGYHVMINIVKGEFQTSKANVKQETGVVDGSIIVTQQPIPVHYRHYLNPTRCILMDNHLPGYSSVNFDTDNDMSLIFDHLMGKGCQSVMAVAHPEYDKAHSLNQRVLAFEKACKIYHHSVKNLGTIIPKNGDILGDVSAARPDALICVHLEPEQYRKLPVELRENQRDLQVYTYADLPIGDWSFPYILVDWQELVRRTAATITRQVENRSTKPTNIYVQNNLVFP